MSKTVKFAEAADGTLSISGQAEATIGDIFTTALSTSEVVTGGYGLIQRVGLVYTGAVIGQSMAGRPLTQALKLGIGG